VINPSSEAVGDSIRVRRAVRLEQMLDEVRIGWIAFPFLPAVSRALEAGPRESGRNPRDLIGWESPDRC
jgi:hypothetical protein